MFATTLTVEWMFGIALYGAAVEVSLVCLGVVQRSHQATGTRECPARIQYSPVV